MRDPRQRNTYRWIAMAIACGLFLFFYIDDWGRDFSTNHAEISVLSLDESLKPFESNRSTEELVEAVTWAAHRIRSWEYVGEVGHKVPLSEKVYIQNLPEGVVLDGEPDPVDIELIPRP